MRTTVTVEDDLVERALALADPGMPRSALFREALNAFVRQQAARRLAALEGIAPDMPDIPRRRPPSKRER
jgi:predicted transcriptional regulator